MQLNECKKEYWEFIRVLRNNKIVQDGFIKSIHITKEMQLKYMKTHSQFYRVALYKNEPCGYVGVLNNDIRICTHPEYQGKGIGKFMLNEIIKIYPNAYAKIKVGNKASINLFSSVGFKEEFIIFKYE